MVAQAVAGCTSTARGGTHPGPAPRAVVTFGAVPRPCERLRRRVLAPRRPPQLTYMPIADNAMLQDAWQCRLPVTTLDMASQTAAESALAGVGKPAALVAVRASTGEVLAVANTPADSTFDRALDGSYPPGSQCLLNDQLCGEPPPHPSWEGESC